MDNRHPTLCGGGGGGGRRRGFTLVELLVVIGIIVVLVSILIPVVGKLRTAANIAATKNIMQQLSGSIEAYYADFKAYPGPVAEINLIGATGGTAPACTGTQNMMFGIMGSYEPPSSSGSNPSTTNHFVSANVGKGAMSFLNAGGSGTAYYTQRYRSYADMINLLPQPWNDPYNVYTGSGTSVTGIPDSVSGLYPPEFVDRFPARKAFPAPFLYLRAHRGTPAPTSSNPSITTSDDGSQGSVEYDNCQLSAYKNAFPELANCTTGGKPPNNPATGTPDFASWDAYFQDPSVITDATPHAYVPLTPSRRWDTFILISAGPDGVFGTADDIVGP